MIDGMSKALAFCAAWLTLRRRPGLRLTFWIAVGTIRDFSPESC